jgi:GWxTD domain-containing protein
MTTMLSTLLCSIVALGAVAPVQGPPKLAVHAVRFFAPEAKQTSVLALLQVPYAITEPGNNRIAWETTVMVNDAQGNTLFREQWMSGAPANLRMPEAYGLESLAFPPMAPGKYAIVVVVKDSVSGRTATVETPVEAYASTPMLSDLLLASAMRVAQGEDTVTAPGEVARGNLRFQTTPELTLDALRPLLSFMMEGYTATQATASTKLEVRDASGNMLVSLPAFTQVLPAGGGVIRGAFPLDGLGEGRYQLHAAVTIDGRTERRTAEFGVGNLEIAMQRDIAMRNAGKAVDEVYFGNMNEDELDAAAEVLEIIAPRSELAVYKKDGDGRLSLNAKRRFLIEFWQKRDTEPTTEANEARIRFYDAIEYANQTYAEAGRNARPGWKTDRGRIYARYGRPDDQTAFRNIGNAPPVEVWRYTQGRLRFYIFADRTNYGLYSLMRSNDLDEPGQPGWAEIVTPALITRELEPFLGQTFCRFSGTDAQNPSLLCN